MATEQPILQSLFPDLPRENPAVDKDGNFTELWDLGLSALFQALQQNFKNEGIIIPLLSAANMTTIQDLYTPYIGQLYNVLTLALPDISGQTVYDTTTQITNQFVISQDATNHVTLAQWVPLSVMLTNAGNPNGSVAGVLNWLCLNTSGPTLYVCTLSGNAANATWHSI
jgi:hypothetical protein